MSTSVASTKPNNQPQTVYLKDYQVPTFLIDEVMLDFDLQDDFALVTSKMRIRHHRLSPNKSKELILNGEELNLESIVLDGKALKEEEFQLHSHFLIVHNVPDKFTLEIVTRIYPHLNTALSGLYRSKDTYCTQCEAEGFRRITYFLDRPDVLARYTTTITADAKRYPYLLSNGNLVASGKLADGRHFARWEDPFKKPCYLFALVAGDFDLVTDKFITQSKREIDLQIFVEKGYADQAQYVVYALKEAMRWDENAYGREYDLDIYMIVAIGDFNMGAMENKGLNIFNTKYVLAKPATATDDDYMHILSVVGHEYFHNWSGNRVTCRDWFQLSLKEGLTIFRDQNFSEDVLSSGVMRIKEVNALRLAQFLEDAGPLAHPVRPESYIEINNFYTATVYNKGAEVLRMLQTILGKAQFRKGMDLYFARHDGQAVTIEDYIKTMEDISGIDLSQFRLWVSQAGTPIVNIDEDYDSQNKIYTLTIRQSCPPTPNQHEKKPFFIPIRMGLLNQSAEALPLLLDNQPIELEKVLHLTEASQVFRFHKIDSRPVPSFFRNFSAPIKLNYAYSDSDLLFLAKHDKDAFNRWEAGQKLALNIMLALISELKRDAKLEVPDELIELYRSILEDNVSDEFLLAEMLVLPSEKYVGEQMEVIDVDAIHQVRELLRVIIAQQLQSQFLALYERNHALTREYKFSMQDVSKRKLKNHCLDYLMLIPQHLELGMNQFTHSLKNNMTDTEAALIALSNLDVPNRELALQQFYETWQEDALVVDKWFAIQAATKLPIALQQVKILMRHPAFDFKNPNKLYSLIGTFGQRNQVNFHGSNGEGYAFLREVVERLDKINPQVAARMLNPLTRFKRYDKERQKLMCEQLELLLQKKLSPDVYELVTKCLREQHND